MSRTYASRVDLDFVMPHARSNPHRPDSRVAGKPMEHEFFSLLVSAVGGTASYGTAHHRTRD